MPRYSGPERYAVIGDAMHAANTAASAIRGAPVDVISAMASVNAPMAMMIQSGTAETGSTAHGRSSQAPTDTLPAPTRNTPALAPTRLALSPMMQMTHNAVAGNAKVSTKDHDN